MRYRLRTLLIVLALGPPVLAAGWWTYSALRAEQERQKALEAENAWVEELIDRTRLVAAASTSDPLDRKS